MFFSRSLSTTFSSGWSNRVWLLLSLPASVDSRCGSSGGMSSDGERWAHQLLVRSWPVQ